MIFGFAPGLVLRMITLLYWQDDPRRAELRAELYAFPYWERPIWVAQQIETAPFEGLGDRLLWAAEGRIIHRWHLDSGVELNRQHPETFEIPSTEDRNEVTTGDLVKLVFNTRGGPGERMWVKVTHDDRGHLRGKLDCVPVMFPRLEVDSEIKFTRDNIIDIWWLEDLVEEPHICHAEDAVETN